MYAPQFLQYVYKMPQTDATLYFGAVTAFTGAAGTVGGGWVLQRFWSKGTSPTASEAAGLSAMCMLAALPFCFAAFMLRSTSQPPFFGLLFMAEMLLFAKEGPVNSAILWSVGEDLKPHAMAMSMLTAHLFGDIPSPPILGWMLDASADFTQSYMCAPGYKPDNDPLPTTCIAGVSKCGTSGKSCPSSVPAPEPLPTWYSQNITSCHGTSWRRYRYLLRYSCD